MGCSYDNTINQFKWLDGSILARPSTLWWQNNTANNDINSNQCIVMYNSKLFNDMCSMSYTYKWVCEVN